MCQSAWEGRGNRERLSGVVPRSGHGLQSIEIHTEITHVYKASDAGHRVRYNAATEAIPPSRDEQGQGAYSDVSDVSSSENTMFKAVGILAGLGMLETGYLGLMSLLNQSVVCPVAGDTASCNTILGSEYAMLWDTIPLSVLGSITYGAVAVSCVVGTDIRECHRVAAEESRHGW